jgi:hypothetical protein
MTSHLFGKYHKKVIGVIGTFFMVGVCDGYNSHPKNFTKKQADKLLVADRIWQGFCVGIFNTFYIPIVLTRYIGRIEIEYTKKDPYDYQDYYDTTFRLTKLYKKEKF